MPQLRVHGQPYPLRAGEYKVIKRILTCIKAARAGLMPGDKPRRKADNFIACSPNYAAQYRRQEIINALGIKEFYYKDKETHHAQHLRDNETEALDRQG